MLPGHGELVVVCVVLAVPSVAAGLIAKFLKKRNFIPWFFISLAITLAAGFLATVLILITKSTATTLFGLAVWAIAPIVALLLRKKPDARSN